MNSAPIALRLASGSVTPLQLVEEAPLGVHRHERHLEVVAKGADHLIALALAHQPVVDEHACELLADGAIHEQRGDRRVHASGQAADDAPVADLRADARDLLLHDRGGRPGALAPADVGQEARQDLLAVRGVDDLGVELDAVDAALDALDRGDGRGARGGERREAGRRLEHRVAVRHPARLLAGQAREQPAVLAHGQVRAPELADLGLLDASAERVDEKLHPVADAEHRNAELEQPPIERRRARARRRMRGRRRG